MCLKWVNDKYNINGPFFSLSAFPEFSLGSLEPLSHSRNKWIEAGLISAATGRVTLTSPQVFSNPSTPRETIITLATPSLIANEINALQTESKPLRHLTLTLCVSVKLYV